MNIEVQEDDGAVIRVVVVHGRWTHRLQGMDRYWWTKDQFGCFNVDTHQYRGKQSASWEVGDRGFIDTGGLLPPDDATVIEGHMVPDDRARELGLL